MIIFENAWEINYYKHEHICIFALIYLDVYVSVFGHAKLKCT